MPFHVSSDIGGTFTDLYVQDERGDSASFKAPTTAHDLTEGLFDVISDAADYHDQGVGEFLAETERFIHGTTVSTNAIIEQTVERTGLICTQGFRDTLWLREGGKQNPYKWDLDYPEPYVPRKLTIGVEERISPEGEVLTALDEPVAREAIRTLRDRGVDAIAVALLWAHSNSVHERRIGELIEEEAPEVHYSLSADVNPIIREYRRTSSTAIDASLYHLVSAYLRTLEERLDSSGFEREPLIISANGGIMNVDEMIRRPIWSVDSGPTMLPIAAQHYVRSELAREDVLALDMGGTSLDMGVVSGGIIPRTRDAEVGERHTMGIEKVQVESIGSGGGSIAWVDDGGLLHVGPESAGADPGPACYERGGERPTFTDAALVLGYLNEEYFLGGEMALDPARAEEAIEREVAETFGISRIEAAHSIFATAVQDMVNGIEGVTIDRGIDPRNYVVSGGGGALGLCVVPIARALHIDEILLPREAGVVSAIGGLASEIQRDFSASQFTRSDDFDHDGVNEVLSELRGQAEDFFVRADVPPSDRTLTYFTEARYPYQVWELEIQLPLDELSSGDEVSLVELFNEKHQETYGFRTGEPVEFLYWRVTASAEREKTAIYDDLPGKDTDKATPYSERTGMFEDEAKTGPAFRADEMSPGQRIEGPGFVDGHNTTIVLPPGSTLEVRAAGSYFIKA